MDTKRKLELGYPLDQVDQPLISRLVSEWDLNPNLLRADIDARKGGWLVVELTGESKRIDQAVEWLKGCGLSVALLEQ